MPKFECIRKCYVDLDPDKGLGRLYKPGDFFEGDKAPTRSFKGYVEPTKPAAKQEQGKK